ncbi:hypothetical protein EXIGLDRAFT_388206 [Exidia glandulosa HHB12029]|uniref:Uncharacterized protein n=1 Tax=Exidia glandulosa HHB12029 TaxID=1314781 RepID=A0A165BUP3_EXIGL|nr:hypothetical protein EXIGLDRAFT_388206 [Exidia glandulosa HHB12029]
MSTVQCMEHLKTQSGKWNITRLFVVVARNSEHAASRKGTRSVSMIAKPASQASVRTRFGCGHQRACSPRTARHSGVDGAQRLRVTRDVTAGALAQLAVTRATTRNSAAAPNEAQRHRRR